MNTHRECRCDNCPAVLTFEDERIGERIQCPHCGLETELHRGALVLPEVLPPIVPPPPVQPVVSQPIMQLCPFCGGQLRSIRRTKTSGWILFVIGLFLVFWCVGVIFMVMAMFMNETVYRCERCGKEF